MIEKFLPATAFNNKVHGYKALNKNWTCLNRQYTCPGEFHSDHLPYLCQTGMHFCKKLEDVFRFYGADLRKIHVVEVEAFGNIAFGINKCSTDGLRIVKELSISDILQKVDQYAAPLIAMFSGLELIYDSSGELVGYKYGSEWGIAAWQPETTKIVMFDNMI